MDTAQIKENGGRGDLISLDTAQEQYWLSGAGSIKGVSLVRRRFLNGSIARFAVSGEHNDCYWDMFFQTFHPMIRVGDMMFDVELQPLSLPCPDMICKERSYRVRTSFFARVLSALGIRPRCFQFTYSVSQPGLFGESARETYRRTRVVDILSVQPY